MNGAKNAVTTGKVAGYSRDNLAGKRSNVSQKTLKRHSGAIKKALVT